MRRAAYARDDLKSVASELKTMADAAEIAQKALQDSGKSPMGHPGPFKSGELRTQEISSAWRSGAQDGRGRA